MGEPTLVPAALFSATVNTVPMLASKVGARLGSGSGGGLTVMVVSAVAERPPSSVTVRRKVSDVCSVTSGAVNEAVAVLAPAMETVGVPPTWLQAKVRDPAAVSASPPTPCNSTVSPASAVVTWAASMDAVGGVFSGSGGGLMATVVSAVAERPPSSVTVRRKVSAVSAVTSGAVKVAVAVLALAMETVGVPPTWLQAKVRDPAAVSASLPTPCSCTVSPAAAVSDLGRVDGRRGRRVLRLRSGHRDGHRVGVGLALFIGHGQLELQRRPARRVGGDGEAGVGEFAGGLPGTPADASASRLGRRAVSIGGPSRATCRRGSCCPCLAG